MKYEEQVGSEILEHILTCNTTCADLNGFHFEKPKGAMEQVDYYLEVVPGASYILKQQINFIFSNSLTTGRVEGDAVLNEFLYRNNEQGTTNYSVLQDAVLRASSYGECGVRWYEGNIYVVPTGTYATLTTREDGIEKVVGYIATSDGKPISQTTFTFDDFLVETDGDITSELLREFEERKWIFLDKSDFVNVRNDTGEKHGKSPFLQDTLRLDLLVTAYERLIHDLKYDGPGRILLWAKGGLVSDDYNDISTSQVMKLSPASQQEKEKKAKSELEKITKDIKESGSDSAILLSNAFEKEVMHLPRVTKATEFLEWLEQEGTIVSQILGVSPGLLELGNLSGNVSMEKIIDNAMLNTIVPVRERYAVQFSTLLSEKLNIGKVYFDKYELQQAEDENTMRTKIANIMSILHSIETPETDELVKDFGEMLDKNIHHENNQLKELKVQKRRTENEQNGTSIGGGQRS